MHLQSGWRLATVSFAAVFSWLWAATAFAQQGQDVENEAEWGPRERQEWFYHQRAYPLAHIPPGARFRALAELHEMRQTEQATAELAMAQAGVAITSGSWTLIGPQPTGGSIPNPYSGRVSAVVVDPTDPTGNTAYIGGAQGGVWKTTDGGTTWTPLTDAQFSLAIGSLAIDPNNHLNIYAGTGEENFSDDSYYGGGLLKSTDGGATWSALGTAYFGGPFGARSPFFGGSFIGGIAIQPAAGAATPVLLVASEFGGGTQYYYYSGIWRSTDGGTTWTHLLPTTFDSNAFGVSVFFVSNTTAYAAIGNPYGDANNGVYRSTDAGQTWTPANGSGSTALIFGANAGKITLVAASSNPSTLYASIGSPSTFGLAGMFKTTDGGITWQPITTPLGTGGAGSTADFCVNQCPYDMALAISPVNANLIYAGGSINNLANPQGSLFMSSDGGTSWNPVDPNRLVHTDVHAISLNGSGSKLYVGSDGGMWSTANIGTTIVTWSDLNATLALTQFYPTFALSGSTPNLALIGTQDNGTQIYSGNLTWTYATCGDGFSTAIDPANNSVMWAVCNGKQLLKSVDGGSTWNAASTGINLNAPGPPSLTMDYQNPNTLYVGTTNVWQTTDGAVTPWTSISGGLVGTSTSDVITTIAVSPVSSSTLFAGTSNSLVWFTTNTGGTWSQIPSGLPPRYVTMVQGDPQTSSTFYVTFSGFSGFANGTDTLGHVFKCSTASAACSDVSSNLPNVPVNDIVVDPAVSNTLYVGTDIGVFRSINGGVSWSTFSNGLPNVAVLGLRMHAASRTLVAATHGRSAWDILVPLGGTTATTTSITLAPSTIAVGSSGPVVVTATVAPASGSGTPTGSVNFFNSSNQVGTANLTSGTAAINYNPGSLAVGAYPITATYNGDATFTSSTSTAQTLTVQWIVSLSPMTLSFGNQSVGTSSAAQGVTLTNSGNATLTLSIALTGANSGDFSQTNTCGASVTAGANCTISVTFKPTAAGNRAASVTITDNASGSPQSLALTGTGAAPAAMLAPTSLNLAGQLITTGGTAQPVTLTNSGTAVLNIANIAIGGANGSDFSQTNTCAASLAAGANCSINVTFKPTATGNRAANITITDDAAGSPHMVTLTGTGTDFTVGPANGASTTAAATAGQTATYNLQVAPISGFNQSVALTCTGAPSEATCTVAPTQVIPTGNTPSTFMVTVGTTAPSMLPPPTLPPSWPELFLQRIVAPLLFVLSLLALRERIRFSMAWRERGLAYGLILVATLLIAANLGGCGGGGGGGGGGVIHNPGTPQGTSTITITGASNGVTHTQNLTLIVN